MIKQPIVIIGFMGSGKTTVGNALAHLLDCRAIDLDSFIRECEQRGPKEIIEQDGEEAFRRIETRALREVLLEASAGVIAAGGGAWMIAENRKTITEHGALVVWLDAPFEVCWKRIELAGKTRPLAPSRHIAARLYTERRPIYELADAHVVVDETKNVAEIAKEVAGAVLLQNENN